MFDFNILSIIAGLPGLLIAMVVHEYAHAQVADWMGDDTPRMTGRLTLNPVAHIDPVGLIMLLVVQFGWAKPVMINPGNFRNWRKGEICVSLAGPMSNLLMAFLALVVEVIFVKAHLFTTTALPMVLHLIVLYNVNFAIFNMIPLPPLDGSRVLMPTSWNYKLASLERYSFLILIALMMTPFFTYILIPLQRLVFALFSLILAPFL